MSMKSKKIVSNKPSSYNNTGGLVNSFLPNSLISQKTRETISDNSMFVNPPATSNNINTINSGVLLLSFPIPSFSFSFIQPPAAI